MPDKNAKIPDCSLDAVVGGNEPKAKKGYDFQFAFTPHCPNCTKEVAVSTAIEPCPHCGYVEEQT